MTEEDKENFSITEISFNYFKAFCKEWSVKLGLVDWKIDVVRSDSKTCYSSMITGNRACVLYNFEGRRATIILNRVWEDEPSPLELNRCALHECGELLMAGLIKMAEISSACNVVEIETHKVIRVLENLLIPDLDI